MPTTEKLKQDRRCRKEAGAGLPAGSSGWKTENPIMRRETGRNGLLRLITRGAAVESIAPLVKALRETEFYAFTEKVFTLPEVRALLMEAVNTHNQASQKGKG